MLVKNLNVYLSQKVNLGNYETKTISIGASAELDENDELVECKAELTNKLGRLLEEEVIKQKKLLVAVSGH